jgi:MscS family membrane protein
MECDEYASELQERQSLYLGILQLAERLGVSFAFPTRTVHMFQQQASDSGPPSLDDPLAEGRMLATQIASPLLDDLEKLHAIDETPPDDGD